MAALTDRAVLIAGATSASGRAAARTLLDAGAHVVATGRDAAKLAPLAALGAETAALDLTDGQTEDDYRALEASFTALRHVSRALDDDLRASSAGRLAIVSSTAVTRPLAGGANYAAVKAASEAWTRAVAQGWAKAARDAEAPLRSAAVVFRVKSLAGLEERLAEEYARLWKAEAGALNDAVLTLQEKGTD